MFGTSIITNPFGAKPALTFSSRGINCSLLTCSNKALRTIRSKLPRLLSRYVAASVHVILALVIGFELCYVDR